MIDDKLVADLKAKYGAIEMLSHDEEDVIVRPPPAAEWKRFRAMISDESQRAMALETLCRACIVYPEGQEVSDLFNRLPGLAETFGNELTTMAGLAKGATRKKL